MYCVYKHTSPSSKVYIGISGVIPVSRWNYGHGYNKNHHFYNAIKKYGWDNFLHEILFEGLERYEAENLERELIKEYKSYLSNYGYNQDMGGTGCGTVSEATRKKQSEKAKERTGDKNPFYGRKHSDETIKRMSEIKKGKPQNPEWVKKSAQARKIKVYQKTKDGDILAIFDSIIEAAEALGSHPQNIYRACIKGRPTAAGFIWDYVDGNRLDRSKKNKLGDKR